MFIELRLFFYFFFFSFFVSFFFIFFPSYLLFFNHGLPTVRNETTNFINYTVLCIVLGFSKHFKGCQILTTSRSITIKIYLIKWHKEKIYEFFFFEQSIQLEFNFIREFIKTKGINIIKSIKFFDSLNI